MLEGFSNIKNYCPKFFTIIIDIVVFFNYIKNYCQFVVLHRSEQLCYNIYYIFPSLEWRCPVPVWRQYSRWPPVPRLLELAAGRRPRPVQVPGRPVGRIYGSLCTSVLWGFPDHCRSLLAEARDIGEMLRFLSLNFSRFLRAFVKIGSWEACKFYPFWVLYLGNFIYYLRNLQIVDK